jgi:hypothetical protein
MNYDHAPQSGFQLNKEQVVAGSVLMGVGGAIVLAGIAMTAAALATAFRRRVQQMDVPPSELARQHWSAVRHATGAGAAIWLKEQPAGQSQSARQPQPATQR